MKKILFIALWVTVSFISCKNKKTDSGKFTISGEILHISDQKIYLDQLYFSQKDPDVLDTAIIKNGKFELSAIAPEEGLFRLRLEKMESGFIFINDKPTISLKADMNDVSLEGPVFNSPANFLLKNLMLKVAKESKAIEANAKLIDSLSKTANSDSLKSVEMKRLQENKKMAGDFLMKFIDTTSDPVVAMLAWGYSSGFDPALLKDIIPNLQKRFPAHQGIASLVVQYNQVMATQAQQQKQRSTVPQVGSMAPDITMNDVKGIPFSLSQLKGKYVLVDFWASWCGPCRGENPNVVAAYNKFKDKNFTILGVSLDEDKDAWQKAIKADNLGWQHISDLKGWSSQAVSLYGFDGIPYNVLIDPQGKIIATSLRENALQQKLSEVLQ